MSRMSKRGLGIVVGMIVGVAVGILILIGLNLMCEAENDLVPVNLRIDYDQLPDPLINAGDEIPIKLSVLNNATEPSDEINENFWIEISVNDPDNPDAWMGLDFFEFKHDGISKDEMIEVPYTFIWPTIDGDEGIRTIKAWVDLGGNVSEGNTDNNNITIEINLSPSGWDVLVSPVNNIGEPYNITNVAPLTAGADPNNNTMVRPFIDNYGNLAGEVVIHYYYQKEGEPMEEMKMSPNPPFDKIPIDPNSNTIYDIPWEVEERFNGTGKIIVNISCDGDLNLSNNIMEFPIEIIFGKDPTITDIYVNNTNPSEGNEVEILVNVTNLGIANITPEKDPKVWIVCYYEKSFKKEIGRQFIGNLNSNIYLPQVTKKFLWTSKPGDAGIGKIYAEVWFEKDDDNTNNLSNKLDITINPGKPDFKITEASISKNSIGIGESLTLSAKVKNVGSAWNGGENLKVEFYADDKNDPKDNNISLGSGIINTPMGTLDTKDVEITIKWPSNLGAGNEYYIIIKADPANTISENREDNNDFNTSEIIKVVERKPNLMFSPNEIALEYEFSTGNRAVQGENITIIVTIKNNGDKNCEAFLVEFLVDDETIKNEEVNSLSKNEKIEIKAYWIAKAGSHIFKVIIDKDNEIDEWQEDDNIVIKEITVDVTNIELSVNKVSVDNDSPEVGEEIEITTEIRNKQSTNNMPARFVVVRFYKNNENLIDEKTISEIEKGESKTISIKWIAEVETSSIWVKVSTDYGNLIGENLENFVEINLTTFAKFEVTNFVTFPKDIIEGNDLLVNVTVLNNGTGSGEAKIILYVNEVEETYEILTIERGEERNATFTWGAINGSHKINVKVFWNDDPNPSSPPIPHDNVSVSIDVKIKESEKKELKIDRIEFSKELPKKGEKINITAVLDVPENIKEEELKVIFEYKVEEGDWKSIGEVNVKNSKAIIDFTFKKTGKYTIKATIKDKAISKERTVTVTEKIEEGGGKKDKTVLVIIIAVVVIVVIAVGIFAITRGGAPPTTPPPQSPQQPQIKIPKKPA